MGDTRSIEPRQGPVDTVIAVPGSKSIANRALVCAALASGTSVLANLPDGDDTVAMLECLAALGVATFGRAPDARVHGSGAISPPPGTEVNARLAGTTSRFVTALAALSPEPVVVDGYPPLRSRPFGPLHDALQEIGVRVMPAGPAGGLPVTLQGPPTGSTVTLPGDVSSQFVSALMMIGPRLDEGLLIELTTDLVSRPYVELTAEVMRWFGVGDVHIGDRRIAVPAGEYRPADVYVEPDASSASYPLAVAALTGGRVEITGLGRGSLQGDARFADLLGEMGCEVERSARSVAVTRRPGKPLAGVDVDMADVSDLVPTLAVVAACASTASRIRGVGFIRAKESDRLGDLTRELSAAGVAIAETDDGVVIEPSGDALHGALLGTHHDHRLAMAFGVLGLAVPPGRGRFEIADPDVVTKSWPGFWQMLESLG